MHGRTLTVDVSAGDKAMNRLSSTDTVLTMSSCKSDILSPVTFVVEFDFEKELKRNTLDVSSQEALSPSETLQHSQPSAHSPPQPSIRLLFSLFSRRDALLFLVPAILSSIVAGGIAPFMTRVVGNVFNAFALFPQSGASAADKAALRSSVGISALELLALAVGAIALGSVTSALWISIGERNLMRIRSKVYGAVSSRDMEWFDTAMGAEDSANAGDGTEGRLGAGGMMAKFNEDTDNVRNATSLASGMLIQYLTTCLTCLVLAFQRSWALTLVILSAIPVLIVIQILSQIFAGPHINAEKEQTAAAATLMDRAFNAITTVKAFNAQAFEQAAFDSVMQRIQSTTIKFNGVFGVSSAFGQFTSMAMFVQGFWFGAKLVRNGTVSAGDVMAVFWACLIAATNIQLCIPQLIILAKGKFSMVSLVELIDPPLRNVSTLRKSIHSTSIRQSDPISPTGFSKATGPRELRGVVPSRCIGELSLNNVTFAYPSRPSVCVLDNVTLFFPARETTFVVGGSGSGKSTIAQLLIRMYQPLAGTIEIDEQDAVFVDEQWLRSHVAIVSQNCILFDGTVHENVALGVAGLQRHPEDVTREEVIRACTAALMHEFVRELPNGYDTKLGNGGANLSGGQKQRLAIARAILRDPTILVLDEATSALDATSRVLVFEAIKTWRTEKTTIVITHDLSQISSGDFVYVLKEGRVVEQGYRADLEDPGPCGIEGEFLKMMRTQGATGGLPAKSDSQLLKGGPANSVVLDQYIKHVLDKVEAEREEGEEHGDEDLTIAGMSAKLRKHQSLGGWLENVPSLSRTLTASTGMSRSVKRRTYDPERAEESINPKRRKYQSLQLKMMPPKVLRPPSAFMPDPNIQDDEEFEFEKDTIRRTASEALKRRQRKIARINRSLGIVQAIDVEEPMQKPASGKQNPSLTSMIKLLREVYPSVPNKLIMLAGVFVCLLSGAMTPVFSALLSRLLFEVSIGAKNVQAINFFGGLVLAITALDGVLRGLNYFIMESGATLWVTKMRKDCYARLLAQDKRFFDRTDNASVRLVQTVITDGDDARNLLSIVLGNFVVVVTMLCVGLIWALVMGWQLTLAGFAIGPVFAVTMSVQANLAAIAERRNRSAREEIAKGYYECISNIRAIRCMSFETLFRARFQDAVSRAYTIGVRGAFVEGCSFGVTNGLIYLAEALLFYVSAVLVANGTYSYLQMVSVLNLVVFTITIGSQLMTFTQKITKARQATEAMNRILALDTKTDESQGRLMPSIQGDIKFKNVCFAYPERPEIQVLKNASLTLRRNECVAIVGTSGSGKTTIASLLQRLYEPTSGSITIGGINVKNMDIMHLRRHISVVSQNPNLFDASVAENIAYGNALLSPEEIEEAARVAHVHQFIAGLPQGYQTSVGESATLISGGQAQRIAIARALARPARVLVLDECTSALDPASQAAVLDALREARVGRTTLVVTHKMAMMRMCDRIIVVEDGEIAEQGSYDELLTAKGVFSRLVHAGEWSGV